MKVLYTLIFLSIVAAGCSKNGDVLPSDNNTKTSGSSTKTSDGGSPQTPPDATPKISHDDSIHITTFSIKPQNVKTSVSGVNLTLTFYENVDLLFTAEGYQKTSAVHLKEDLSNSLLAGFDFTTVAEDGNTTLNWVDDNLNNVVLKTVKDTVINNVAMVKIKVRRPFTFFKACQSKEDAVNQQASFKQVTSDSVTFSSYCYYNQKNYKPVAASANIVYK
jgi:hypothetical protein